MSVKWKKFNEDAAKSFYIHKVENFNQITLRNFMSAKWNTEREDFHEVKKT